MRGESPPEGRAHCNQKACFYRPLECESKAFAFGPRNLYTEVFHWPDQHICQAFRGKPVSGFES